MVSHVHTSEVPAVRPQVALDTAMRAAQVKKQAPRAQSMVAQSHHPAVHYLCSACALRSSLPAQPALQVPLAPGRFWGHAPPRGLSSSRAP